MRKAQKYKTIHKPLSNDMLSASVSLHFKWSLIFHHRQYRLNDIRLHGVYRTPSIYSPQESAKFGIHI